MGVFMKNSGNQKMLYRFVEKFNREHEELYKNRISDAEAADWMAENIPLLDCDDPDVLETYYFRFWTFRKHIKDSPEGTVITEFLPEVGWFWFWVCCCLRQSEYG